MQTCSQLNGSLVSQTLAKDDEGNVDYYLFTNQLTINRLMPKQVNVSFLGKVRRLDRESGQLTLADSTGEVAVRICSEMLSRNSFEVGHCLLLTDVAVKVKSFALRHTTAKRN